MKQESILFQIKMIEFGMDSYLDRKKKIADFLAILEKDELEQPIEKKHITRYAKNSKSPR
jgi:hypothetical protein